MLVRIVFPANTGAVGCGAGTVVGASVGANASAGADGAAAAESDADTDAGADEVFKRGNMMSVLPEFLVMSKHRIMYKAKTTTPSLSVDAFSKLRGNDKVSPFNEALSVCSAEEAAYHVGEIEGMTRTALRVGERGLIIHAGPAETLDKIMFCPLGWTPAPAPSATTTRRCDSTERFTNAQGIMMSASSVDTDLAGNDPERSLVD